MTILFLNSIGTGELIFILFIVLILFGSKSLPTLMSGLGKTMREVKGATDEIRQDIQNSAMEIRKDMDIDLKMDIDNPFKDIKKQIESVDEPVDFRPDNPKTSVKAPESTQPHEPKKTTESNSKNTDEQ